MSPETPNNKPHLQQVDYIRCIASVAVALFHLGGKSLPGLRYGWLGVQMFFLLSGFIICWALPFNYDLRMFGKFIGRRIIRIEPSYFISILLVVSVQFLFSFHYQPNWKNILFHFAYLNSFFLNQPYLNPVYWTLAIEFQYYLLIALIFPLIIKQYGFVLVLLLCIAAIFVNVPAVGLIRSFPLFGLGIMYFLYLKKLLSLQVLIACLAFISGINWYISGLLPLCAGLFALLLIWLPLKANKLVKFFSNISFSLYLTHDTIGANLVVWMGIHLPKTILFKGMEFISGIAVSITFAYLFYLLIERPSLNLSKLIYYKK